VVDIARGFRGGLRRRDRCWIGRAQFRLGTGRGLLGHCPHPLCRTGSYWIRRNRLHSRYWGEGIANEPALGWVQPYMAWTRMGSKIPVAIEIMGDTCPEEVRAMSVQEIIEDTWAPFVGSLTTSPQTFLHGDAHIGNTYVLPDNDVGFLDWQVVRRGNWSVDVGYFLQGRSRSRIDANMKEAFWRSTALLSICLLMSGPVQTRSSFATGLRPAMDWLSGSQP
jgi:Phosphotransferase enzyme family